MALKNIVIKLYPFSILFSIQLYQLLTNIWPLEGVAPIWMLECKTLATANAVDIPEPNSGHVVVGK